MLLRKISSLLPISYQFLQRYTEEVKADPTVTVGQLIHSLYLEIYAQELTEEQILQVCERLQGWAKEAKAEAEKVASKKQLSAVKPNTNRFGHRFAKWFEELTLDQLILWVNDYDVKAALECYTYSDRELVDEAIKLKARYEEEKNRITYEGSLFGFGGGYGKGKGPGAAGGQVVEHDFTKLSGDDISKRLAAMQNRR